MNIRPVYWAGLSFVLAACAVQESAPPARQVLVSQAPIVQAPVVTYLAPERSELAEETFTVNASVPDALDQIVDALDGPRFGITHLNKQTGLLTARYNGDPSPFVECGKLILESSRGQVKEVPGAVGNLNYEIAVGPAIDNIGDVRRGMILDGYLIVQVQPATAQTSQVSVRANYVLTRTVDLVQNSGSSRFTERSYVSFSTGEAAQFAKGGAAQCQANGAFEASVAQIGTTADPGLAQIRAEFAQLSCASLTARRKTNSAVVVSGFVASYEDLGQLTSAIKQVGTVDNVLFSTEILPPPFCSFLEVTAPLEQQNQAGQYGTRVALAGGGADLSEGDLLVIEATTPRFESYPYLFYIQNDGQVIHLLPTAKSAGDPVDAGARVVVGDSSAESTYRVAGPFGRDLIVLVTSASPLFDDLRPQLENADGFVSLLAGRVAAARAAGQQVTADHLFVQTTPLTN